MQNGFLWIFIDWGGWFCSEENNLEEIKDILTMFRPAALGSKSTML